MTTHVYIPTRARTHVLEKTLPKWRGQDVYLNLVVDPVRTEQRVIAALLDELEILRAEMIELPRRNMGMGRIRQHILDHAVVEGLDAFVQADDDCYPVNGNVEALCSTVLEQSVIGCGASSSYHGLMIGNEVLKLKTRFPCAGGWGHIMFAINTELAMEVGGYPSWATAWGEDTELQRQGIAQGMPWWYNTRVRMGSAAPRYSPGGLSAQYRGGSREKQERRCHAAIYRRWPQYISKPSTGRFRCAWKKMMDDYIPDWRDDVPKEVKKLGYGK